MSTTAQTCRTVPIERVSGLDRETFHRRFLSGAGRPAVVTGALRNWNALSAWSFDFFRARYGSDRVIATIWPGERWVKIVSLGDYINYLDQPRGQSPGFWVDPVTMFPLDDPPDHPSEPLYLSGWRAFNQHPELLDDIEQSPRFVEDWLPLLPPAFRKVLDEGTKYFSAGVLIGPAGSLARLHTDFLHTHAYLAQIAGRKKCVLFSPADSAALYQGKVDPEQPDLDKFPEFERATAFECTLEPGELLFMPGGWWHQVRALEKSITVNYNFFNQVNFGAYLTGLMQVMPSIVDALRKFPDARAALGIDWECKGFAFPNSAKK